MYLTANKKMLNMLILDILHEYSDEDHRLTQQEILRILKSNYGVEFDRRSVKNNVIYLKEMGYDIAMDDGYYLISREFDDAELRLLIDSVLFSKSLTLKQSKTLIEKLCKMGNRYFKPKVSHICNLPELQHMDNKQLLYALDTVNDAIAWKKKISFIYNEYKKDLKLHPRREEKYVVNPYQIVANNGFYYLIGNYDKYDDISHFRLDKMTNVELIDEKVKLKSEIEDFRNGYSLPRHMAEHIYMFSGKSVRVKFLILEELIDTLVDWFGNGFNILETKEGMAAVSVSCNERAMYFWALQYGPYVEVLEPAELREKIAVAVREMNKKYHADCLKRKDKEL